jgi:membrane-bound lytic murein transglycosylase D
MIESALDKYNLPHELKYLPIIESAFNPKAVSRVGAKGLWQFMFYTGKQYGLVANSYIDERFDPMKSTHAAMKYLRDLYNFFQSWDLAIAAYNCGPGNVKKAIIRSGGKTNFWQIYRYLPRETRGYIPAFIAVN